jgi:hypothetical protein
MSRTLTSTYWSSERPVCPSLTHEATLSKGSDVPRITGRTNTRTNAQSGKNFDPEAEEDLNKGRMVIHVV